MSDASGLIQVEAEVATELSIRYEIAVVPLFLFFKVRTPLPCSHSTQARNHDMRLQIAVSHHQAGP